MAVHFSYAIFSETDLNIYCRNIDRKIEWIKYYLYLLLVLSIKSLINPNHNSINFKENILQDLLLSKTIYLRRDQKRTLLIHMKTDRPLNKKVAFLKNMLPRFFERRFFVLLNETLDLENRHNVELNIIR